MKVGEPNSVVGKQAMPVLRGAKPRRRGNRKLLFLLFLFFLALLGVLFFESSFSKINRIEVTGARLQSEEQILEAAGIGKGDHFFAVGSDELERRVMDLDAVKRVAVTKRFPGYVRIEVEEHPVVALELGRDGSILGLLANGKTVPFPEPDQAVPRPLVTGWNDPAMKAELSRALAEIPPEHLRDVSEIRPIPSESYRDRILLYTRSRYEVVTRIAYLAEKIALLDDYIYEMEREGRTTGRIVLLEADYGEGFEREAGEEEKAEETKE